MRNVVVATAQCPDDEWSSSIRTDCTRRPGACATGRGGAKRRRLDQIWRDSATRPVTGPAQALRGEQRGALAPVRRPNLDRHMGSVEAMTQDSAAAWHPDPYGPPFVCVGVEIVRLQDGE